MLKKQYLAAMLISFSTPIFTMEQPQPAMHSDSTQIRTDTLIMQSSGPHTYHTHAGPTASAQQLGTNPLAAIASSGAEGLIHGIFQGVGQGVGAVIAQKIITAFHEPVDERDARLLMTKHQQIANLATLRSEVSEFCNLTSSHPELTTQAQKLRLGYGLTLLAFIEKQKKEEVCIITPLLHKLQHEVCQFAQDAKNSKDQAIIDLCNNILVTYGTLLDKQLLYEKESSSPAIIIHVR